jgi:hemoglobin
LPAALLVGAGYLLIGRVFAVPVDHPRPWRLAAWLISAALYAAHIGYEHHRLKQPPRATAMHVATAVGLGAFALGVAGAFHTFSQTGTLQASWLLALLVLPPVIAAPAFVVAWPAASLWAGYGPRPSSVTLYEALGGAEGVLRLAGAWHRRVLGDEVVAHAFSHGYHPEHTERLAAYWGEALGGPPTYTERYGSESSVVRTHSGNGPHEEMDRRAIACFDQAMDDIGLTEPSLRGALHDYFEWATTTTMAAYPDDPADVPADLRIPKWSWDGLEG